jgi:pullulanase/glycogen debranching enzyme
MPLSERVRVQNLGAAITLLSQGIPFLHAGQEILRSKSLDRDSYDAGDWFNKLDYSYQSNNFGVGLPMEQVNKDNWPLMAPILANPLIKPDMAAIVSARDYVHDLLAIRSSSTLFRLRSAQDVGTRLHFHNTGPQQVPGVVVMRLEGAGYPGARYRSVVVVFNADKVPKSLDVPELAGRKLRLHPVQQSGSDRVVRQAAYDRDGRFSVPPRTAAVFVEH